MKLKKFSSSAVAVLTIALGGVALNVLSATTPLTQSAQAATYFPNCPFSAKIYQPTKIRPNPNTYTREIGVLSPNQTVAFSSFENGQEIRDETTKKLDPLWFKLSDGRGYVASAVVQGYPPESDCKTVLPTTISQANQFFKLQFSDPKYNPGGPSSSLNCGPASLAMTLAALKLQPSGLTIQQSIDRANNLMERKSGSSLTTFAHLRTGIQRAGRVPQDVNSWRQLDNALAASKPVILNGLLQPSWQNQFPSRVGSGNVAHLNAVLGKAANGNYLVADPMHTGGVVEMNRQKLAVFFDLSGQNGTPSGIAVSK